MHHTSLISCQRQSLPHGISNKYADKGFHRMSHSYLFIHPKGRQTVEKVKREKNCNGTPIK